MEYTPLLTSAQVAEILNTTTKTVNDLARTGLLKSVNLNRKPGSKRRINRFLPEEIQKFIENRP